MLFRHRFVVTLALLAAAAGVATAQGGYFGVKRPGPESFNGAFTFCRLAVQAARDGDGGSWAADYPRADENLSLRLSELTKTQVNFDGEGGPASVVIRASDPALFDCPFVALTNPGRAFLPEDEVSALRTFLQKGGFLWSDDFWGTRAWEHWERELRKVLPAHAYPLVDLDVTHPMFRTVFPVKAIPQIPNIGFYQDTGWTSERGSDSRDARAAAILDSEGRVMVLITHNTDFGDAYEREAEDPEFFHRFSVDGYAIGIDVLVYAMTH
ncbi:MAG: DUF4159 domain-containing protein [Vicinamibacterales bacterium]